MNESRRHRAGRVRIPQTATPNAGAARSRPAASVTDDGATGTATLAIPFPIPEARGLVPELTLAYDSRGGNGVFGRGFAVAIPSFTLDLSLGTPRYDGADAVVFRDERLVALLRDDGHGNWTPQQRSETVDGRGYAVVPFRPRVEHDFTRLERWTAVDTGEVHWRTVSPRNERATYGRTSASRVADPADARRVVEWLIDEERDADGNAIVYTYRAEDDAGVPELPSERGRARGANRYVARISYGNYGVPKSADERFAFDVVFDYGDVDAHDPEAPRGDWLARPDPFSTYTAGFERRTHRLCRGILICHRFPALRNGTPVLAHAMRFTYESGSGLSLLSAVDETGYRTADDGTTAARARPGLRLAYTPCAPEAGAFTRLTFAGAPVVTEPLDAGRFALVDLDGEGLPGIVLADGDAARYWEPLGDGAFAAGRTLPSFPLDRTLGRGEVVLADVDLDGRLDVAVTLPDRAGYYRNDGRGGWEPFQAYDGAPVLATGANELIDLDGRGGVDLLVPSADALFVHRGEGVRGFATPVRLPRTIPLESGGPDEIATFANPFGDGRRHFVRIRAGSVEVWPNLGGGRFGAVVRLDAAPAFAGGLDARRVLFADLDGSGCDDLIAVHPDRVELYRNPAGNGFEPPVCIPLPERFDALARVSVADVFGNGVATLVMSVARPEIRHYAFAPEAGGVSAQPPFLLARISDALGSTTEIGYRSSTAFALADRRAGNRWPSPLPAPLQLVEMVRASDHVSGVTTERRVRYHDGYVDPVERVFCGFGRIERWDVESFDVEAPPPARVVTWYETGAPHPDAAERRAQYFTDPTTPIVEPTAIDPAAAADAALAAEARFALRGRPVREEIYGEDGNPRAHVPYRTSEFAAQVRLLQPRGPNRNGAFLIVNRESVAVRYERDRDDPRVAQTVVLDVDTFGNVTRDCEIAYARREPSASETDPLRVVQPDQRRVVAHLSSVAYAAPSEDAWWLGVACETKQYELLGLDPGAGYFAGEGLRALAREALANAVPYATSVDETTPTARLVSWTRTAFWDDALTAAAPARAIGRAGLVHHEEHAAFPDELARAYLLTTLGAEIVPALDAAAVPAALRDALAVRGIRLGDGAQVTVVTAGAAWTLSDPASGHVYLLDKSGAGVALAERTLGDDARTALEECGYVLDAGYRWNVGEVQRYAPEPERYHVLIASENQTAPAGSSLHAFTRYGYDEVAMHVVTIGERLDDATENVVSIVPDYQALQPRQVTDANGIVTESLYDGLGELVASSVHKGTDGDLPLASYHEPDGATFADVVAHPERYLQGATAYHFRDLFAWQRGGTPVTAVTLARETHVADLAPGTASVIAVSITYLDGVGRPLQRKVLADQGRWRVVDRAIRNAKGLPMATYLPYWSAGPGYDDLHARAASGVLPPPTRYTFDAVGRGIRRDSPEGFFAEFTYAAWWTRESDENDTVLRSAYYAQHKDDPALSEDDRDALAKSVALADTPNVSFYDPRGRVVARSGILLAGSGANAVMRTVTVRDELDEGGRIVASYDPRGGAMTPPIKTVRRVYTMDASVLLEVSADAGVRVQLDDVYGNQRYARDGRGTVVTKSYDRLHRLTVIAVRDAANAPGTAPRVVESLAYGESLTDGAERNAIGLVVLDRDQAGTLAIDRYDIGERPAVARRRFASALDGADLDWTVPGTVALESGEYVTRYAHDAFGRLVAETVPDGRTLRATFSPAGHLATVTVEEDGVAPRAIVTAQDADALGRTTRTALGNGAVTTYGYDLLSGRLRTARTDRASGVVHDHAFAYDAVGNVTRARDRAPDPVFWNGAQVPALCDYQVDTLYRLVAAQGRQQPGAAAADAVVPLRAAAPADLQKLEIYRETYAYDDASNLTSVAHAAASGGFTRTIAVDAWSNRLVAVDGVASACDRNGNVTALAALRGVAWSWRNAIAAVATVVRDEGENDGIAYRYDASGRRARRIVTRAVSSTQSEQVDTCYVGSYERKRIVRVSDGKSTTILDRTALRVLDQPEDEQGGDAVNRDAHHHPGRVALPRAGGRRCFATLYRWAIDARGRESETTGTMLTVYALDALLGSIAIELDEQAQTLTYEEFAPYGGTAVFAARTPRDGLRKRYRFTGAERDVTGLYGMGARAYAPWLGRWLSSDPAGTLDGLNTFLYCAANPATFVDPRGLGKTTKESPVVALAKAKKQLSSARSKLKAANAAVDSGVNLGLSKRTMQGRQEKVSEASGKVGVLEAKIQQLERKIAAMKKKAKKTGLPARVPAEYNPGGPVERYLRTSHPGPSASYEIASPGTTHHVVTLHGRTGDPSGVADAVRWYAQIVNREYLNVHGPVTTVATNRSTSGSLGDQASAISTKERKDANKQAPGTYAPDEVVMHMPDSSISGVPYSALPWMAGHKTGNSIVGGGVTAGKTISAIVVHETDGRYYHYQ